MLWQKGKGILVPKVIQLKDQRRESDLTVKERSFDCIMSDRNASLSNAALQPGLRLVFASRDNGRRRKHSGDLLPV